MKTCLEQRRIRMTILRSKCSREIKRFLQLCVNTRKNHIPCGKAGRESAELCKQRGL